MSVFFSHGERKNSRYFPLLPADFPLVNPKAAMLFQPVPDCLVRHAHVLGQSAHCDLPVYAAGFKGECNRVFSLLGFGLFRLPFLHSPLPPRHLPLRVDVGQDAAVIAAVNGVIEPEVDRGKLGKLPQGSLNAPRCQAFSGLSCGLRVLCRIFILPAA